MSELEQKALMADCVSALESTLPALDDAYFEAKEKAQRQPQSAWVEIAASYARQRGRVRELIARARS